MKKYLIACLLIIPVCTGAFDLGYGQNKNFSSIAQLIVSETITVVDQNPKGMIAPAGNSVEKISVQTEAIAVTNVTPTATPVQRTTSTPRPTKKPTPRPIILPRQTVTPNPTTTPKTKTTVREFNFQGISIGDAEGNVVKTLGQPSRKDLSEYGFEWYIYNKDYKKYIQVGIKNGKVVGLYTNAANWKSRKKIEVGTNRSDVRKAYGNPLQSILKGNTFYQLNNEDECDTYLIDDCYVTVFFDLHNETKVTSVQVIEKNMELSLNAFYGKPSERMRESFERQVFDLANAIRVRLGKEPYQWDDKAAAAARKHSKDMAVRNYFAHDNPDGKDPFERMAAEGIKYQAAAENIACGQPSAIFAHEGWMNSAGHRKNILGDCERLGVGVYLGGDYLVYYTQNFYSPYTASSSNMPNVFEF